MVIKGGNDLTTGVTGIPGFIVLAMVNMEFFPMTDIWLRKRF